MIIPIEQCGFNHEKNPIFRQDHVVKHRMQRNSSQRYGAMLAMPPLKSLDSELKPGT